ncbi:MAG: hypothetical protein AAF249_14105 [Pseudomonadota bacterium]
MTAVSRQRQIFWIVALGLSLAAFAGLSLTVHFVRNAVLSADMEIVSLKKKRQLLHTEFQARASQHQLARWNRVDLGFVAPRADQYLDGRKQLAELGQPLGPGAPSPIRVASADAEQAIRVAQRKMVSPISGKPITLASLSTPEGAGDMVADAFGDFLIEASPIRPAKAQTGTVLVAEAVE